MNNSPNMKINEFMKQIRSDMRRVERLQKQINKLKFTLELELFNLRLTTESLRYQTLVQLEKIKEENKKVHS